MFKSSYKCSDCKYQFEKITKNFPKKDPSCPKCKQVKKVNFKSSVSDKTHNLDDDSRVQEMIAARKPPSSGKSNFTKAMDYTSEMVMQDYQMTNLQDNLREGDSMAGKLSHEMERKVDAVFAPQKPIMGQGTASSLNKNLMRQINSGAFKGYGGASDVVARQQASGIKPHTNILFEHNQKPN
jgi:glutaredoxin